MRLLCTCDTPAVPAMTCRAQAMQCHAGQSCSPLRNMQHQCRNSSLAKVSMVEPCCEEDLTHHATHMGTCVLPHVYCRMCTATCCSHARACGCCMAMTRMFPTAHLKSAQRAGTYCHAIGHEHICLTVREISQTCWHGYSYLGPAPAAPSWLSATG